MPPPTITIENRLSVEKQLSIVGCRLSVGKQLSVGGYRLPARSADSVLMRGLTDNRQPTTENRFSTDNRFSRPELPHHLHHGFDVLHRRLRKDSMAEIEDVARTRPGPLE